MTRFVEPSLQARQLYFLALIVLAGFILLDSRLEDIPLEKGIAVFDQLLQRLLLGAIFSTVFFVAATLIAIHYTRKIIKSGQWPPSGMAVPFRTKVVEVRNPRIVWGLLVVFVLGLAFHTCLTWFTYAHFRSRFDELKPLLQPSMLKGVR